MTLDLLEIEGESEVAVIDRVLQQGGVPCFTCSFQVEDMVVLNLLRQRVPNIAVLFLDTGYHFAETYAYCERMTSSWNLNLIKLLPEMTVAQQEQAFGLLYQSDTSKCCHLRKVAPLMAALERFDIWFTGMRREQSPSRANLKKAEQHRLPSGKHVLKVNPLVDWTWFAVLSYVDKNRIETLPLYDQGYLSIGCEPCTRRPTSTDAPRSGRWSGQKLECGLHTFTKRAE